MVQGEERRPEVVGDKTRGNNQISTQQRHQFFAGDSPENPGNALTLWGRHRAAGPSRADRANNR